jgi:hypothetical protein
VAQVCEAESGVSRGQLAMIFAPCLLHSGSGSVPITALTARREQEFVLALLENLSLPSQQASSKYLGRGFPNVLKRDAAIAAKLCEELSGSPQPESALCVP